MISEENLAQLRALIESILDERGITKKKDKTAAERMRRYRARKAKQDRNVTSRRKRNGTEGETVTLRNAVPLPEWMPMQQWEAYVEMRKKIKKPMTQMAMDMAIAELEQLREAGHHPARVLAQSVFHSWQGLFEVRDK